MNEEQYRDYDPLPTDIPRPEPKPRKPKSKVAKGVGDVFSGEILFRERAKSYYPIMLYCAFLILLYIAYVFNYQRLQRIEIECKLDLQEERSRALVFQSLRMNSSRHSEIMEQIRARGIDLQESPTPPKVIKKQQ